MLMASAWLVMMLEYWVYSFCNVVVLEIDLDLVIYQASVLIAFIKNEMKSWDCDLHSLSLKLNYIEPKNIIGWQCKIL